MENIIDTVALVARLREFAGRVGERFEAPGAVAWGEAVNAVPAPLQQLRDLDGVERRALEQLVARQ